MDGHTDVPPSQGDVPDADRVGRRAPASPAQAPLPRPSARLGKVGLFLALLPWLVRFSSLVITYQ